MQTNAAFGASNYPKGTSARLGLTEECQEAETKRVYSLTSTPGGLDPRREEDPRTKAAKKSEFASSDCSRLDFGARRRTGIRQPITKALEQRPYETVFLLWRGRPILSNLIFSLASLYHLFIISLSSSPCSLFAPYTLLSSRTRFSVFISQFFMKRFSVHVPLLDFTPILSI